ncbi:hypothetical protein DPMN_103999 [Dreissena polymorpha]|uniref:Uncharacterized protein n=1 Tax=Dreissena polymorpha TaxID=45954 RepID=A0A9D4K2V1_DREPO|nr:hypothetical protein DPMN_103999 [Dreissena polymorpha]
MTLGPTIMKLHRYIDHDSQMTPIDFEVTRSKVKVTQLVDILNRDRVMNNPKTVTITMNTDGYDIPRDYYLPYADDDDGDDRLVSINRDWKSHKEVPEHSLTDISEAWAEMKPTEDFIPQSLKKPTFTMSDRATAMLNPRRNNAAFPGSHVG